MCPELPVYFLTAGSTGRPELKEMHEIVESVQ
jgi:hypothetical protein